MAGYVLIQAYLEELRRRLQWHRDVDDLLAEAADHLTSAVERYQVRGDDAETAQRRALDQFGDPRLVALAFATSPTGGLIVPTRFTRAAGTLAIASAVCWLIVPGTWWLAGVLPPVGGVASSASGGVYAVGVMSLLAAGILMMVVMLALAQRHGGLGLRGLAGPLLVGLGIAASALAWVFIGWGLVMLVATAIFAWAMLERDLAPRWPTLAFGGGLALGAAVWAVLRGLDGSLLEYSGLWGDYWIANLAGISVGSIVLAVGLLGLGRWLRSEVPAELGMPEQALRA